MLELTRLVSSRTPSKDTLSCCARVLGCEVNRDSVSAYGTTISVETLPIGIDTEKIEHDAFSSELELGEGASIKTGLQRQEAYCWSRQIRQSERVIQKLEAFEIFGYVSGMRETVVLIQVSSPGYHTQC